jgi:hypothetical protein
MNNFPTKRAKIFFISYFISLRHHSYGRMFGSLTKTYASWEEANTSSNNLGDKTQ